MFCGVAFLPAMRCAGSPPGTTMKITKTMKVTAMQHEDRADRASDEERVSI